MGHRNQHCGPLIFVNLGTPVQGAKMCPVSPGVRALYQLLMNGELSFLLLANDHFASSRLPKVTVQELPSWLGVDVTMVSHCHSSRYK